MKDFKKIFAVGLIAVLVFSLAGCKSDDNPVSSDSDLTGTWVLSKIGVSIAGVPISLTPAEADYQITMVLKSDKTYQMSVTTGGSTTSESGTFTTADGKITLTPTDGSPTVLTYTLSGSTLTASTTLDLSGQGLSSSTEVSLTFNKQ